LNSFQTKTRKNPIVEYRDYQMPVTHFRDQREMEICKQQSEIEIRHLPVISIYGYLSVMGVKVGVENFFWINL